MFLIVCAVAVHGQVRTSTPCYPGLDCPPAAQATVDVGANSQIAGFRFTQSFVLDGIRNLLWARDLYAIGDTTTLFKAAYFGDQKFPAALDGVKERAAKAEIGGMTGWHLPKKSDLDSLFARLDSTTVYMYFRPRVNPLPLSHVLAVFDGDPSPRLPIDGVFYNSTAQSRSDGHYGTPQLNKYGVWMVQSLSPQIESTLGRAATPLTRFSEPVEEVRIHPVELRQIRKRDESYEANDPTSDFLSVSTTPALNQRAYARYNLKPIPRGAIVSAEVVMRGIAAGGRPLPIVTVQVSPVDVETLASPKDLWAFPDAVDVNIWQMTGPARLELPLSAVGNIYRSGGSFYVAFSASFNHCDFQIPDLVVRYVREENLLSRRQSP